MTKEGVNGMSMISEILRALGLITAGALMVLIFIIEHDAGEDPAVWDDADWEQAEDQDP